MRPYFLACPAFVLLVAACSSGAAQSPDTTLSPQGRVRLVSLGPTDWVVPDDGNWTTPVCGNGCKGQCVDDGRYQAENGVVYDTAHDAFWERDAGPQLLSADAARYCASLSLGGAEGGWRLPTYDELSIILYKAGGLQAGQDPYCAPAIDQAAFVATPNDYSWTADDGDPRPRAINFFDGRDHRLFSDTPATVRCIHDPATTIK
jgi:hypothetical protein